MVEENNIKNVTLVKIEENTDESVQPALIIDAELPSKLALVYGIKWIIHAFVSLGSLRTRSLFSALETWACVKAHVKQLVISLSRAPLKTY